MRWGLIPWWAKNVSTGSPMINARAETVAGKSAFRDSLRRRRCLVLADGFYEWQRTRGVKRPMRIVMRSGEPFAFAGLWLVWRDPNSNRIPSCAIITTAATSPSRAGSRREWPGSTAGDWARWPTARPGCSWLTSARWGGPWWTNGCICRRTGPRTKAGAQRRGCRRRDGATGRRPGWPWRCWSGPWSAATSGPSGCWGRRLRDVAVLPGRVGGAGDALRAGRPRRHHGVAAGAGLDQCGVSGIRASPQTQVARRSAPDHGAAQR